MEVDFDWKTAYLLRDDTPHDQGYQLQLIEISTTYGLCQTLIHLKSPHIPPTSSFVQE